jgi:hypothetical protein
MYIKEIIKVSVLCLGMCGITMLGCGKLFPGLVVLSVTCLGGMLLTSKNVVGN